MTWFPQKTEKVPANAQEVELHTHYSTGIKGGENAGIWAKKCEIFEECYLRQWVGMIRGESAGKCQFNILNIGQIESSQSDTQPTSEQEEKYMIKQL